MIISGEDKRALYRAQGWWGDQTLADLFAINVAKHPARVALIDAPNRAEFCFGDPSRLTYADMAADVDRMASALLRAGLTKDDVLMVQLPNISEFVILYFAAAKLGVIVSPVAVQYRSHELSAMMAIVRPKGFVCATHMHHQDHIGIVTPLLGDAVQLMTVGPDAPPHAIDLSAAVPDAEALSAYRAATSVNADDIFSICWTSGTTGMPKGVPRSHNHWVGIAPATYETAHLSDGEVMLNPFPLINMASIGGITMAWLRVAGTMVLHHPFDAQVYLRQIATERPGFTIAPPAILNMLLQNEALLAQVDLSSLHAIGSGSAPLAPAMVAGFQERFGITVINLFGSNEGVSMGSGADELPDPVERARYFPRMAKMTPYFGDTPMMGLEKRLVPVGGGPEITEEGVAGELLIRGPMVFEGYWNALDQTAEAFTDDGFFRTGDLFEIAGGGRLLLFVGRCKDLIIRGGVNIAPEEIDQLLGGHPLLAEACAFALPDPVMGERIGLAYVPRGEEDVPLSAIADFLAEKDLAKFKWPERLFRTGPLPRNVTNKVMRSEVRQEALDSVAGEGEQS